MKRTNIMRVAVALLALTLITSCFVGGTFAKYTTSKTSTQSARVANFGVTVEGPSDLFAAKYGTDDTETFEGEYTVSGIDNKGKEEKVVAPGTSGETTLFSITGKPEVAVRVNVTLNNRDKMQMIYYGNYSLLGDNPSFDDLKRGITISSSESEDAQVYDNFDDDGLYCPIIWTLEKDGTAVCIGNLAYINQYIEDLSGEYAPNTDLSEIFGTYTLSWKWEFERPTDKVENGGIIYENAYYQTLINSIDTKLGNLMAGTDTANPPYSLNEGFNLSVSVTQID